MARARSSVAAVCVLLAPASALAPTARAQDAAGDGAPDDGAATAALPRVQIVRTSTPPTIDGILDPAEWSGAATIDDFVQARPVDRGTPTERSAVYLMYDDDMLYIGGRFWDSEPDKIAARILKQGTGLRDDDRFAVVIDPFNNRRGGYRFELNANGVRVDALYENLGSFSTDWDSVWQGTGTIVADGWTTEMAIPFKTLSFDPANDTWGMNFGRAIRRKGEEDAWVSRNRQYNPSVVGLVTGISGIDQGLGLDLVPSVSAVGRRQYGPTRRETDLEPSLDVFYKITPSFNAALTINTDFSATEVDNRQVNLTRFSLFFPEKRAFFLRDADLFDFGNIGSTGNTATDRPSQENGRPFFSRRLGLSATGAPVNLDYGGKLSGRVGRWTVGALAVRQDSFDALPASNVFVGRATANVMGESSVGLIVTGGDPNSPLDNSLYGADFRYLNTRLPGGRRLEGEAWYERSDTDGTSGGQSAYGFGLRMPNSAGWRGGIGLRELDAGFNPALGFVSRTGIRERTAELGYTRFRRDGYIQQIFGGVDFQSVDLLTGGLQSRKIAATPLQLESRGRDVFKLRYIANEENVAAPFELYRDPTRAVVVAPGSYSFDRYGFDLETGGQRGLSMGFTYREGGFYGGDRLHLEASLTWKPIKRFYLDTRYDWNDIDVPEGHFVSRLVEMTTGVIISSKLSWVTLIQYDNVSENLGVNSRIHWIPEEGREGFIVLNHNLEDYDKDGDFESLSSDLTLKFSYTFRF